MAEQEATLAPPPVPTPRLEPTTTPPTTTTTTPTTTTTTTTIDLDLDAAPLDIALVHEKPPKPPTPHELPTRKLYVRTSSALTSTLGPLKHLTRQSNTLTLHDESLPLEAVAHALEWLALTDPLERAALDAAIPDWPAALGVLGAASWLGVPGLRQSCEARLRAELVLDNALLLASAAERCDALLLLSDCFYLLRAYFCSTDGERPALRAPGPPLVLLADAVEHGELRLEHDAWRPIQAESLCREAHLRMPQPHYTLCTLQRERCDGAPSVYRLLAEHDGRPMLVAQQRAPGEDFLIFAAEGLPGGGLPLGTPPAGARVRGGGDGGGGGGGWFGGGGGDDDEGSAAAAAAAAPQLLQGPSGRPLDEHSAQYRGCVSASWMGAQHRVYDSGLPPTAPPTFPWPGQRELAVVLYAPNMLRGTPHSLTVLVRDDGEPMEPGAADSLGGSALGGMGGMGAALLERYRAATGASQPEGVAVLRNSAPVWNDGMAAFTLPFYSRAQLPSKKNFHIVRPEQPDDIVLLFGKHSKAGQLTTFSLDFCRPLSCLAAFGIALTAFGDSE